MANLYDKSQTLNFLDKATETMRKFTDFCTEWNDLYDEYVRNGIGDITQDDMDGSTYENRTPAQFTTAIGAATAKHTQIMALADIAAHRSQIEVFANRR